MNHYITIQISEDDLVAARQEFPSICPPGDPKDWGKDDLVHALAALNHRNFAVVNYHGELVGYESN